MKKFILMLMCLLTFSCTNEKNEKTTLNLIKSGKLHYFKDLTTGLCYAEFYGFDKYSFTCVPCDSISKIKQ